MRLSNVPCVDSLGFQMRNETPHAFYLNNQYLSDGYECKVCQKLTYSPGRFLCLMNARLPDLSFRVSTKRGLSPSPCILWPSPTHFTRTVTLSATHKISQNSECITGRESDIHFVGKRAVGTVSLSQAPYKNSMRFCKNARTNVHHKTGRTFPDGDPKAISQQK